VASIAASSSDWIVQDIDQELCEEHCGMQKMELIAGAFADNALIVQRFEQNQFHDEQFIKNEAFIDKPDKTILAGNVPTDLDSPADEIKTIDNKLGIVPCKMSFPPMHSNPFDPPLGNRPEIIQKIKIVDYPDISGYIASIEEEWDFGDAPNHGYHTFLASNGARHIIVPGFYLGQEIDGEPNGQTEAMATGDDISEIHDEDGIVFTGKIIRGAKTFVDVTASQPGFLNAWMDFNGDGDWMDQGEKIISDQHLDSGKNSLVFDIPASASPGQTYARFRYSSSKGLSFEGPAQDGEVEDYLVQIA
jgi:hypothetical protein